MIQVEYDGSAIQGQPRRIEFAPTNDTVFHLFTGRLKPRHFASESTNESCAVYFLDLTVSTGEA